MDKQKLLIIALVTAVLLATLAIVYMPEETVTGEAFIAVEPIVVDVQRIESEDGAVGPPIGSVK